MVSAGAPTLLKLLSTKYTVLGDGPSAMSACQFSAAVCKGLIFAKAWLQQTLCGLQSGRVLLVYCQLVLSEEGKNVAMNISAAIALNAAVKLFEIRH